MTSASEGDSDASVGQWKKETKSKKKQNKFGKCEANRPKKKEKSLSNNN